MSAKVNPSSSKCASYPTFNANSSHYVIDVHYAVIDFFFLATEACWSVECFGVDDRFFGGATTMV